MPASQSAVAPKPQQAKATGEWAHVPRCSDGGSLFLFCHAVFIVVVVVVVVVVIIINIVIIII